MRLTLRRTLVVAATITSAAALSSTVAWADPSAANGHNCAGSVVSSSAGPEFGPVVAAAARQQVVDDFGLANCGQDNRNNP